MDIIKSSRHSKITGDFAEHLVLYWLSKHGFECARVDHTGIDLIAKNPVNGEVMGISVKARSRTPDREKASLIFQRTEYKKVADACEAFGCEPYFALVIDAGEKIRAFILEMDHLQAMNNAPKTVRWSMTDKWLDRYYNDEKIMIFEFQYSTLNWWKAD